MALELLEQQLLQNIHEDIKQLRGDHGEFKEKLARIEENQKDILGNGQPGRLTMVERSIKAHKQILDRARGGIAVLAFLCGGSLIGLWKLWTIISTVTGQK